MAKQEFLSGGLVTSREASLLQPGELQIAEDVLLKPGSLSIFKAPGRSAVNGGELDARGLAFCAFDGAPDRLAAISSGSFYTLPTEGGTLVNLGSGAGSSLDAVSLTNRAVLLTGASNKVLLKDGTLREQGLLPVTSGPGLAYATGGTNLFATLGLGFYDYWTTEVYKTVDSAGQILEEIESTFQGKPTFINVVNNDAIVTVNRPSPVNINSTHWRAYRSNHKTNATDAAFPIGFMIGEQPRDTSSFADGGAATAGPTIAGTGDVVGSFAPWSNPDKITADDAVNATSGAVFWNGFDAYSESSIRAGGFGFAAINSPVTNITVQVEGLKVNNAGLKVQLSWDGGAHWTSTTNTLAMTTGLTTPSTSGLFGRTWSGPEFVNGVFYVNLIAYPTAIGSGTIQLDWVKVSVTHGGTSADTSTQFANLVITAGPVKGAFGSHGKPPAATTGDIFQGALVTNDVANPTNVAWTIPGTIDYSPAIYRLSIDTKDKDSVKCIRALSNVLLVGSEGQVHRMNYLPLEDDPEFNTGRCVELVDPDDGMVGPLAACKFVIGSELRMFYIGRNTLRMSNGFSAEPATDDIIWTDMLDVGQMSRSWVVNNGLYSEIKVYFPHVSGVFKVLRLNYHNTHLKNGKLKVVGLTNYQARAGTAGINSIGDKVEYTSAGGQIYTENVGNTDPSGIGIRPRVKTRDIGEIGSTWELDELGVNHQANSGAVAHVGYTSSISNYPDRDSTGGQIVMSDSQTSVVTQGETGDTIAIELSGDDDSKPWTVDFMTLFEHMQGETAPLKR